MKALIKNSLAIIIGLAVGSCVNLFIVIVGPNFIPPPAGVDVSDFESIAASMHLFEPKHFLAPFLGHSLGTLVGALVAFLIAQSYRQVLAYLIGGAFLAGGISMVFVVPSPFWFTLLDLVVAYVPMAWLGMLIGRRIQSKNTA